MQRLKPSERSVTGQRCNSVAFRQTVTLIEKLDLALEALHAHAEEGGGGLEQDKEADPEQGGGVALRVGADAGGFGVPALPVTHVATGTRASLLRESDVDPDAEEAAECAAKTVTHVTRRGCGAACRTLPL